VKPDPSTESWDAIADDWVQHADTNDYRNLFLMPRMLAMLGDLAGQQILDLGCGEGGYSREMARRGAAVTGVDGSPRLIDVARERTRGLRVTYICANASALDRLRDGAFDRVVAPMSLMDVEDYDGAVREAFRVVRPDGELLMSITHPCFTMRGAAWMRDAAGRPEVFTVDRYFERAAWPDHVTQKFRAPVIRRHRTLEDYMAGAIGAGFVLLEFHEAEPTEEELRMSSRFAKIARIPYFLFLLWAKP
jgi:2-polyprenyl-3-methyl-5-hydroxy-6-metoxy-1,4-benzoquinol methylase